MKPKVYIDGQEGTTGLKIYERLAARTDIDLLLINPDKRKDTAERSAYMRAADLVFLCLPDQAAREAVSLFEESGSHARIIDTSTAHRTSAGWVYGLPELSFAHRESIRSASRTANPGCHATGFISLVYPLMKGGFLAENAQLSAFSITGYSGGGKKMIAAYEAAKAEREGGGHKAGGEAVHHAGDRYCAPRIYGLSQSHKHLPEMQLCCNLKETPLFFPIVADFYSGMAVTLPLGAAQLKGIETPEELLEVYAAWYAQSDVISVGTEVIDQDGMLCANAMAGTDRLVIYVGGTKGRMSATAVFDNLGKGASGAAVQNMNLMLGYPETEGLHLGS